MITGDRETVEHICACYGLAARRGASMTAVSRGAAGRIWRLDLADGSGGRFAVKELFRDADEEAVRREAAFTARLAAGGIGLPASLPGRGGRFLAELPGPAGGGQVRLYRWADGGPADLADPGTAGRAGRLLGRLHALAPPAADDGDRWYDTVPDPAVWADLAGAGRAQRAAWAPALAGQAGLLRDLTALVTRPDPGQLVSCHRDLHPDNVLAGGPGELVLLDWDDAGPACPGRELARMLADWHVRNGAADAAAVRRTLAAYRAAGGPGQVTSERSFGMLIACTLNFLHGQARAALDPGTPAGHRDYAAGETAETLTRLPAPGLLADLLSLAATG